MFSLFSVSVYRGVIDVNQDELGIQGMRKRFDDKIEVRKTKILLFISLGDVNQKISSYKKFDFIITKRNEIAKILLH